MTNLLILKEKIVGFYKNFEYPILVIGKFILAVLAFNYINDELGYFEALTGVVPMLFLSIICAVVPVSIFVLIFALVVLLHLFKLSMVLAAVALVVFLLFYFIYLKFAPDQGILIVLYPVLARLNLHYMIPLVGAMTFNPFAALPIAFGVIFMKIIGYLQEAASLGDPGTDIKEIMTSYQYIFDKLLADKEIVAYIVVFTLVILIVYGISRLPVDYSWYIAMSVAMVVVGSVIGGLLAALAQFMGCTLDYAGKESLQFEDDDYYYYVKAIPKIQITQAERTVKTYGKKQKKAKKFKKDSKHAEERSFEEQTEMAVTDDPSAYNTQEPARTAPTQAPVDDFDELSFDGFDFDELDQK